MMPLEQITERIEFPVADGQHQFVIGTLFSRGFHGGKTIRGFNHAGTRMNMDFFERSNHGGRAWLMLFGETPMRGNGY
jgi:hypothetical protein